MGQLELYGSRVVLRVAACLSTILAGCGAGPSTAPTRGKLRWFHHAESGDAVLKVINAMESAYRAALAAAAESGHDRNRTISVEFLARSAFPAGVPVGHNGKEVLLLWLEAERLLFSIALGGRPLGSGEEMIVGRHLPRATGPTGLIATPARKGPGDVPGR